tara:strand:+ start:2078 stop:2626 length:549 start_codon:yes stop_codon:yes gene_type:complete
MKILVSKGFTMIEIVIVIFITGIIGSMAASLLYQGADIYVDETNRQGFVSESRSAFWRIMRETQGQRSSEDFGQSGQEILNLKNANNISREFRIISNEFQFSLGGSNYSDLSNSVLSNNFYFYNNVFSDITPPSAGLLSQSDAEFIHLTKLKFTFQKGSDSFSLSSYIYPINFRFGKKMSYH